METERLDTQEGKKKFAEEIKLFIEYGVAGAQRKIAFETLSDYTTSKLGLLVLKDFYSRLPELREEAVTKVSRIVSKRGMFLLGVHTTSYEYLYFFNGEEPFYLGEKSDGIGDSEILEFFGYANDEDFLKKMKGTVAEEEEIAEVVKVFCPACAVAPGELHELGCPVEICPWCDGQLSYCNCRFEKLGVDEIVEEREIDRLEILLNEKGRIPFSTDHAPSYPGGGGDI